MSGFFLLFANVCYVICQFLVLSILSKNFTPNELGEYFLALAISAPVMIFFALKFNAYVITTKDFDVDENKGKLLVARIIYSAVGIGLSFAIYSLFFYSSISFGVISFVLLIKLLEQFDDFFAAYFSKNLEFISFAKIKITRGVGLLFCVLLSLYLTSNFNDLMILSAILYCVFWCLRSWVFIVKPVWISFDELKLILKKMYTMGLSSSFQSLATSGSRTYIGIAMGTSSLATFGCISYLLTAVNLVTNALGTYYLPHFTHRINSKKLFLKKLVESQFIVLLLSIILLFITFTFSEDILTLLFNKDVASYSLGLFILSFSASFKASSNLMGTAFVSTNKYSLQLIFTIVNLIALSLFLFVFKSSDLMGVFWALLLATVIEWSLMLVISIRYFNGYFKSTHT
jgi:O-antigen/teichoic acid export membrane protein